MWFLPNQFEALQLPDAVMFLPSHYSAADRDALCALLRVMAPELPLALMDARALARRRLSWAGGVCVVYDLRDHDDDEDEALRACVAHLGARHCLLQRPTPRLTGSAWMEPLLKVPLLRALERAWRDPMHPLQSVHVRELPLRTLAQYTDDPAELMALVREALEHRMRHAAVGVSREDWARSVDHALALRLQRRIPEGLGKGTVRYVLGIADAARPDSPAIARAVHAGLGFDRGDRWRASPIAGALERPLVARIVAAGLGDPAAEATDARDFLHMARETWVLEPHLSPVSVPEAIARAAGTTTDHLLRALPGHPHLWLALPDTEEVEEVRGLLRRTSALTARDRPTMRALAHYLRGVTCTGADAQTRLREQLDGLLAHRRRVTWSASLISNLRLQLLLLRVSRRGEQQDIEAVGALLRDLVEGPGSEGDDLRLLVRALALSGIRDARGFGAEGREDHNVRAWGLDERKVDRLARLSRGRAISSNEVSPARDRLHGLLWPEYLLLREDLEDAWSFIASGRPTYALQLLPQLAGTLSWTLVHLHAALARAVASLLVGDLDAAFTLSRAALDFASKYDIPLLRAFAREVLAGFHEQRGESEDAVSLLQQSWERYQTLGDVVRVRGVQRRLVRLRGRRLAR